MERIREGTTPLTIAKEGYSLMIDMDHRTDDIKNMRELAGQGAEFYFSTRQPYNADSINKVFSNDGPMIISTTKIAIVCTHIKKIKTKDITDGCEASFTVTGSYVVPLFDALTGYVSPTEDKKEAKDKNLFSKVVKNMT